MRPYRIGLKDDAKAATFGQEAHSFGRIEHDPAIDLDAAFIGNFKPGDTAQDGRLAATARTEQRQRASLRGRKRDVVDDSAIAEAFRQPHHRNRIAG